VEVNASGLQETVFEVVEVEHDVRLVHFGLRIALCEVEPFCATNLQVGQEGYRAAEQFALAGIVVAASLAPLPDGIEEGTPSQVLLQIAQFVGADGHDLGHGQLLLAKMAREVDEGMILFARCAHYAYERLPIGVGKPEIPAIAAAARDGLALGGSVPGGFLVELNELFHPPLFHEYEVDGQNQAEEGSKVVPVERLAVEEYDGEAREYHQRDDLLDDLELHQVKFTAIAHVTEAIGRHLARIFG